MRVDVWSDVVCPFCYIGKRKLEMALARTGIQAQIHWHSFELDPAAPRLITQPLSDLLADKYHFSPERAAGFLEQQQRAAEEVGLEFNWRTAKRGNTFDAHRLIQLAKSADVADAVTERLFRAYFAEGAAIGDPDTLRELAFEAGLATEAVDSVLGGDAFAAQVRADQRRAGELGIHAVPYFLINEQSVISGAGSVEQFVEVLLSQG